MAHFVGVGIAALDIINTTDGYPPEDSKVRAIRHDVRRGGNTANILGVLSQLGHECHWCGVLGDDQSSEIIRSDLLKHNINMDYVKVVESGHSPTSYIILNKHNGSRTIVHYRDLPEYAFADFKQYNYSTVDWIHFEGRNIDQTAQCLGYVASRYPHTMTSLEVEKPHVGIESLFASVKIVFYSRQYALSAGFENAMDFLTQQTWLNNQLICVCSWGDQGACVRNAQGQVYCSPAIKYGEVVDSIGAGDTFNAGFMHAYQINANIQFALEFACSIAGKKCSQYGFDGISI